MVGYIKEKNTIPKRAGRKGNFILEDKLLMALESLREYRTYFHLGKKKVDTDKIELNKVKVEGK